MCQDHLIFVRENSSIELSRELKALLSQQLEKRVEIVINGHIKELAEKAAAMTEISAH